MSKDQEKNKPEQITAEMLGTLHQNEIDLLWLIRTKFRFGEIGIITRDGLPQDLLKTVERRRLGGVKTVVHSRS